jgi:N-acetylglucosaminyldiphosphoundecaprenol N-acetyl-beta-D-mannosaminyltransferase
LTKAEDDQIIQQINQSGADIVWVGISSPKQERWMYNHLGKINAPVMIGVGAAFDFLSGNKRQAPDWIQKSGFEWLYRFLQEPRRLWRRYKQYPLFVVLVVMQILGIKDYS